MEKDCIAEINLLHEFFVEWLTGALPGNDRAFARCADALADGFVLIGPDGKATGRKTLLGQLRSAHGACADAEPPFAIRIENPRLVHQYGEHALFTYEEWQDSARGATGTTGRLSTALLIREPSAPTGIAWRHLHESWIAGHAP